MGRTQNRDDGQPRLIDAGSIDAGEVGREHLRNTIAEMIARSDVIRAAITTEELAVVGANYSLREGLVTPGQIVGFIGDIAETVSVP